MELTALFWLHYNETTSLSNTKNKTEIIVRIIKIEILVPSYYLFNSLLEKY